MRPIIYLFLIIFYLLVDFYYFYFLFMLLLGFNDKSALVGHFVSSPRDTEKRARRDSRGDEREGQGRKRK